MAKPVAGFNANPQNINKDGRPKKGYSITEMFQSMLSEQPDIKEALTKSIIKKALSGDTSAQKMVWSYMDGMPKQSIDITVPNIPKALDELEDKPTDYNQVAEKAKKLLEDNVARPEIGGQNVEVNTPIQDQEQTGAIGDVQAESPAITPLDAEGQPSV